jgi:hypothetical protein
MFPFFILSSPVRAFFFFFATTKLSFSSRSHHKFTSVSSLIRAFLCYLLCGTLITWCHIKKFCKNNLTFVKKWQQSNYGFCTR